MATIASIKARQIFDSRGNPTVEVDLICSDGTFARAAVPSGASTGIYEALELRDGGSDYLGKGVSKAVDNVNTIIGPALIGKNPTQQTAIDNLMVQQLDGTVNEWGWCKQKLGANAILAVSLAVCKAGASVLKTPLYKHIANIAGNKKLVLPVPAFNVINGGSHAGNKLAMQACFQRPFFCSQSLTLTEPHPQLKHRLKKVQKLEALLNRGRTITARRFLKSLLLTKTAFSSLSELHSHVSKPLFSDTLLWLCSVSKMLNEATDLYSSMRKDGFIPSTRSVNRLLRTLVDSRHLEKTLALFADVVDCGVRPDAVTYGKAVQAAVMLRDLDKGFELMRNMEKEGVGPSVFAYNLVLGGLCKVRRIKDARKLFDEMIERNRVPNTVTFNTLIDGYCKVGDLEEAFALKGRMKERNVECNLVTYNCLLNGLCGSGRLEDSREVLLEMEGNGFLPRGFFGVVFDDRSAGASDDGFFDGKEIRIDERTYCILLSGLCRVGRVLKAEEVLAKLVENGIAPSTISYNILVYAYCQEGDVKKAILTTKQMEERGLELNHITFNTVISKLCETGEVDQAETWVKRMNEKGVSPTVETYNSLINGYGLRGHFVRCFEILEEMEKAGIKPNVISYGSLINCLCKDRKLLDAEIVLADMIGRGVSPNAEIYNMLIEASCSLSKLKDASRFFHEMIQAGIDATLVTYNTLINGLGRNGRVKEAEDLFLQMAGKGCNPDVITYNSLISGYAKSVNTQKCLELYDSMKRLGIKPTIGTFHPLIYTCRKEGVAEVERMFQEMLEMDLVPDRFVYNEMIYSYAEDGNVLKAMSLHQQMVDHGVDSDNVTYNCLILAHLRDRRVSEIKHLVDDMKAKGLILKIDTYNILVKGHCDLKDFNGAYFWYREMVDVGLHLNARICYELISGLREEGMLQESQIVSSDLSSRELNN